MKIAVIFGGDSNEREISLESGRNVFYKLPRDKYDVIPLFMDDARQLYKITEDLLANNATHGIIRQLTESMRVRWSDVPVIADFVFLALHGGSGENGCVQGALEMLGIPYNGSSIFTSALCMDKHRTNSFLAAAGFAVPRNYLISKELWLLDKQSTLQSLQLPYPLIAKPHNDGCSVMVSLAYNEAELIAAVETILQQKDRVLVEERIVGMELTVGVVGNERACALPPSYAVANKAILSIEEKFLPGAGENQTPAPLPEQALIFVQRMVEAIYQTLGCKGYARIDCFYQTPEQSPTKAERLVFLECNTLPGITPATVLFHQAAELGISPSQFLDLVVELGLQAHAPQRFASCARAARMSSGNIIDLPVCTSATCCKARETSGRE